MQGLGTHAAIAAPGMSRQTLLCQNTLLGQLLSPPPSTQSTRMSTPHAQACMEPLRPPPTHPTPLLQHSTRTCRPPRMRFAACMAAGPASDDTPPTGVSSTCTRSAPVPQGPAPAPAPLLGPAPAEPAPAAATGAGVAKPKPTAAAAAPPALMSKMPGTEHEGKYAELVALVQSRANPAAAGGGMLESLLRKVDNPAEESWTALAQEHARWALHADKQELEAAALKVGARMRSAPRARACLGREQPKEATRAMVAVAVCSMDLTQRQGSRGTTAGCAH